MRADLQKHSAVIRVRTLRFADWRGHFADRSVMTMSWPTQLSAAWSSVPTRQLVRSEIIGGGGQEERASSFYGRVGER
jgi:hypothetical protein